MKAQSQSRDLRCKARSNPWGFHRWHFKTEPHQRTGESGMKKRAYLKDNWRLVLLWLLTAGLTELVMYFFQVQAELMILTLGIWLLGLVGTLSWDYMRKNRFYRELEEKMGNLEEKYLIQEMIKKPEFLEGRILYNTVEQMGKAMSDQIFEQQRRNNAFKQYVETWIHEVKLPIASMRLLLHKDRGETSRVMKEQVSRIDSYVEQVLYYLRSQVPEMDYAIREYSLKAVTDQAISRNRDSLILNHIRVIQETEDIPVLTDEKWLSFILGQLLSNSVKYKREEEACIRIRSSRTSRGTLLSVWDNGMGIQKADLPRIFEHSFTGENGRRGQSSTGMGLYLCKKLCHRLGHRIWAESEKGVYTEIFIEFGQDKHTEMA